METTAKPTESRPDRPGFFIVAILLHVVEGLVLLLGSTLGALGLAIGLVVVAIETRGDEAVAAILGILLGSLIMAVIFGVGLVTLFLSYKAWSMKRGWIWAILIFSLLSIVFEPWGFLLAAVTVVGAVQALDRTRPETPPAPGPSTAGASA